MLRLLLALPFLLLLVLFALSNPQPARLGLWPTDLAVDVPLSIVVLAAMAASFLLGTALLWANVLGARLRARRAEHRVRGLEAQVADLRAELAAPRAGAGRRPALTDASWRG